MRRNNKSDTQIPKFNAEGRACIFTLHCWSVWVDKKNPCRFEVWNGHSDELCVILDDPEEAKTALMEWSYALQEQRLDCDVCKERIAEENNR